MCPDPTDCMEQDVPADATRAEVYSAFDISTDQTIIYDTRDTAAWIQSDVTYALDEMR